LKGQIKLSEVLPDLEKEIERVGKSIRPINERSRRGKKRAQTLLLLGNYSEVVLILRRILESLNEIVVLQARIKYDEIPEAEKPERERLIRRSFDLVALLRLDMKALYIWTALITDILRNSGTPIDLDELDRISLFRHKLITHVHETFFFKSSLTTKSGTMYHPKLEIVEDMYLPFDFSNRRFVGLHSLVRKASSFIPELVQETNRFEQIKLLYRGINRISNAQLKRSVKKFVFKVGLPTDSPGVIANALLQGLRDYRRN
jgi:hypothetical protein